MNERREGLMQNGLKQSRFENKSDVVESALRHYIESIENANEDKDVATPEEARRWSTSEVKLIVQRRARTEY